MLQAARSDLLARPCHQHLLGRLLALSCLQYSLPCQSQQLDELRSLWYKHSYWRQAYACLKPHVRVQARGQFNDTGYLEKLGRKIAARGVRARDVKVLHAARKGSLNYTKPAAPPVVYIPQGPGGSSAP